MCCHYTNAPYFSGETCRNRTDGFCMASRYVNHYTNAPYFLDEHTGFEPATSARRADMLPLHQCSIFCGETCRNRTDILCLEGRCVSHYTNAPCGGSRGAMLLRMCTERTFRDSFALSLWLHSTTEEFAYRGKNLANFTLLPARHLK